MTSRAEVVDVALHVDPVCPAFEGHFPGAPVLPGAYLLALVLREIDRHAALAAPVAGRELQVQQVKFLAPVRPGDTLRVQLRADDNGIDFTVQREATPIARGRAT
jgi:3-hydroxymyristoyl/3-hydroxydecanoyl-(acyl carrier protein) dehydratase